MGRVEKWEVCQGLGLDEDEYGVCTQEPGEEFLLRYDLGADSVVVEDSSEEGNMEKALESTAVSEEAPKMRIPDWMGTVCPECGARSAVMETRKTLSGPRRRFLCENGHRFTTIDHALKRVDLTPPPNGRPIVAKEKKDEVTG